ncbi:hypothetical protein PCYB_052310 [Plasmodium cynomolgi strain B]|uniref:Serine aminopeptidase S33 domain-containing protein n=1 Tax=Plasmodium cynomolgi (strain B) TaxID=1120755 RepID=K6UIQ2_PLACD|nr:hypothetical protein PCYB_052310 [Plasmodium cynomolgi strain B]GAB65213.1 hypothetical protein PCYB_052310 [Plasmodium cynomolgi strain B]
MVVKTGPPKWPPIGLKMVSKWPQNGLQKATKWPPNEKTANVACDAFHVTFHAPSRNERACGTNEGTPSEEQFYKDALVPLNYLKQKHTKQLFIFGNSMGGAVALETASRHQKDIYGVIVENPFLSIKKMSEQNYPFLNFFLLSFEILIRSKMDNTEKIKRIHVPLLINTSERDEMVPPEHSRILFELCPSKYKFRYISKKGTHNNIIKVDDGSYHASLKKFVQTAINIRERNAEPQAVPPLPAAA